MGVAVVLQISREAQTVELHNKSRHNHSCITASTHSGIVVVHAHAQQSPTSSVTCLPGSNRCGGSSKPLATAKNEGETLDQQRH